MRKTTVYIPDDLKRVMKRLATDRDCSEAEVIRQALQALGRQSVPPRPRLPLFRSRKPRLAERADAALVGFGRS